MSVAVSLIIVSQKRPAELERAIAALVYQSLRNFEIIVVADQAPLISVHLKTPVTFIEFQEANISKARNLGVLAANAQIIAFCDDDAIPDPFWLERLCQPFYDEPMLGASTGFCRGRNGISFQWKAIGFLNNGVDISLPELNGPNVKILPPHPDYYYKTIGTNCAFKKAAVCKIGGFDESFFYYLEDADINLRLQDAGHYVSIVPGAEIIHNYKESRGRGSNRVPKSLYNLGASTHHFLIKHCKADRLANLDNFYADQEERMLGFFHLGLVRPRQIKALMRDLRRGIVAGADRDIKTPLRPIRSSRLTKMQTRNFAFVTGFEEPSSINPEIIPIHLRMFPTAHAARLTFRRKGYWRLTFGRFGRLERSEPWWKYRRPSAALKRVEEFLRPRFSRGSGAAQNE